MTSTSPGTSEAGGNFSSSAFTVRGRQRLNTGMARGECTSGSPLASSSSQAKSCASEMISENAVRITVSHISSTTVTSRLHMISSEIGSDFDPRHGIGKRRARRDQRARRRRDADRKPQVEIAVDLQRVAGRHDGGRLALLDDRRTFDPVAGRERVAIVDGGFAKTVAEPDLARAFLLLRAAAPRLVERQLRRRAQARGRES